jgi:hypothetical protein
MRNPALTKHEEPHGQRCQKASEEDAEAQAEEAAACEPPQEEMTSLIS